MRGSSHDLQPELRRRQIELAQAQGTPPQTSQNLYDELRRRRAKEAAYHKPGPISAAPTALVHAAVDNRQSARKAVEMETKRSSTLMAAAAAIDRLG